MGVSASPEQFGRKMYAVGQVVTKVDNDPALLRRAGGVLAREITGAGVRAGATKFGKKQLKGWRVAVNGSRAIVKPYNPGAAVAHNSGTVRHFMVPRTYGLTKTGRRRRGGGARALAGNGLPPRRWVRHPGTEGRKFVAPAARIGADKARTFVGEHTSKQIKGVLR